MCESRQPCEGRDVGNGIVIEDDTGEGCQISEGCNIGDLILWHVQFRETYRML